MGGLNGSSIRRWYGSVGGVEYKNGWMQQGSMGGGVGDEWVQQGWMTQQYGAVVCV